MLLLTALILVQSALASPPAASRGASEGSTPTSPLTLEQLETAGVVLKSTIDGRGLCGLKAKEAGKLMEPLHALIDEALARAAANPTPRSLWTGCEARCTCGIYSDLLTQRGDAIKAAELQAKAAAVTSKMTRKCVKTAKWFCRSPLLKRLRASAHEFQP